MTKYSIKIGPSGVQEWVQFGFSKSLPPTDQDACDAIVKFTENGRFSVNVFRFFLRCEVTNVTPDSSEMDRWKNVGSGMIHGIPTQRGDHQWFLDIYCQ